MIDKIIYKLFGYLDLFANHIDKIMFPKPKKKPKKKGNVKTVIVTVIVKQNFIYITMMGMSVFVMPVLVS